MLAGALLGCNAAPKDKYGLDPNRVKIVQPEMADANTPLPIQITVFFAAQDMNWDSKKGNHEPWDGFVMVGTNKFACSNFDPHLAGAK